MTMTPMKIQIAIFQAIVDHNNKLLTMLACDQITLEEYLRRSFPAGSTRIVEEAVRNAYKEE